MTMKKEALIYLKKLIRQLEDIEARQRKRAQELGGFENIKLEKKISKSGTEYYCSRRREFLGKSNARKTTQFKYFGKDSESEVGEIKEAHYLKTSISILEKDIELINRALKLIEDITPYDHASINALLPKVYRSKRNYSYSTRNAEAAIWKKKALERKAKYPPLMPQYLKYKTADGTFVRSKSEVIIYNFLLTLGVTFVYELPIETENGIIWPDFTILSEIDYKTLIIIEHQGMIEDSVYKSKIGDKVKNFIDAGFVPEKTLFLTYDIKDNGLDTSIIQDIIGMRVRPSL